MSNERMAKTGDAVLLLRNWRTEKSEKNRQNGDILQKRASKTSANAQSYSHSTER